ncbi:MAG: hypothetical protein AAF773_06640 [Cyanobacteria bacterium P01_D01_bin.115]
MMATFVNRCIVAGIAGGVSLSLLIALSVVSAAQTEAGKPGAWSVVTLIGALLLLVIWLPLLALMGTVVGLLAGTAVGLVCGLGDRALGFLMPVTQRSQGLKHGIASMISFAVSFAVFYQLATNEFPINNFI